MSVDRARASVPLDRYFVTHTEAARIARVTPRTIRRWVASGRLTRYAFGVDVMELQDAKESAAAANPVKSKRPVNPLRRGP